MQLYSPWALILLLVLPAMAYLMLRRKGTAAVRFPSLVDMKGCMVSWRIRFRPLLMAARLVGFASAKTDWLSVLRSTRTLTN